ncbi:hypothetical protein SCHPADRAFT_858859 [Schizopora paradoxa]|uniref:Cytosolic endo-beta-N-acetylglucosaminidase TIM barrel domain-containing protein n=1 Tax=Schizopora paradoxa TaxID=27342 RepID=A0A0H2RB19_9AGAM|nr:hypothetical protein SCHPADRAFT_858859 [Schizopora paradoxa]
MPLAFGEIPCGDIPLYFKTLSELDEWHNRSYSRKRLDDVLAYTPRNTINSKSSTSGQLLICHDYKGGYTEYKSPLSYTFNFWDHCDTFIYFSHHRVTIPPPSWINAAHKHGTKMLGVLIFEHAESAEDLLRLLLGNVPASRTSSVKSGVKNTLPVSAHYARELAQLASDRGFDGYLLNVEYRLEGGPEQVRAIEAWISILNHELKRTVGPHAQTIWYDSVIINGDLRWQDRLNTLNLPFFLPSTSFFTNYTWPSTFPSLSAQYMMSLDASLLQESPKTLKDIFVGVDVWGRGSHGGGGFGCFKALEHTDTRSLGLSSAIFGPAWTWESEQDKEGWNWQRWWAYERKLWIGPERIGEQVDVPPVRPRPGEPPCAHGDYKPLTSFFDPQAPPNPYALPFYTSFSPGVGFRWFVGGAQVMHKPEGWTDIDKQTSLGSKLWPRPSVSWDTIELEEPLPTGSTSLIFDDAYNGGSTVRISICGEGSQAEESAFRCMWIPVQAIAVTPVLSYTATIVYKPSTAVGSLETLMSVKLEDEEGTNTGSVDISGEGVIDELPRGWCRTSIQFVPTGSEQGGNSDKVISVGLILSLTTEDPSLPYGFSLQLGQLSVYPTPPTNTVAYEPRILWADCEFPKPSQQAPINAVSTTKSPMVISWDTSISFTSYATINPLHIEDPNPPWVLDRSPRWYPKFQYFNIYALRRERTFGEGSMVWGPEDAQFIGTSGLHGTRNKMVIDASVIPERLQKGPLRVFIQGLTETGEILPWDRCVYVDIDR